MVRAPAFCISTKFAALLILLSAGCNGSSSTKSTEKGNTASAGGAAQVDQSASEVEDQLRSALYQLQPENLNIDSRIDDAVSVLNNWWAAVQTAKLTPTGLSAAEIPADRLPADLLKSLQRNTFDIDDGRYIRGCYLARRVADQVTEGASSEIDRVVQVFEWVCRNIALRNSTDVAFPVSFYEALVLGRGTASDRALAVALILKQLKMDCVILQAGAEANSPWLLGVLHQQEILLFDPQLGFAIPQGPAKAGQPAPPATWSALKEHPQWLDDLRARADQPYGISADQVAQLSVKAISLPMSWAPRIWAMEQLLPGESMCVLYDPPATIDQFPGVFERVAAVVPGATASQIGLWEIPLKIEADLHQVEPVALRALQTSLARFSVPVEYVRDEKSGAAKRSETLRHLRIRTEQLFGERGDAISQYITIRQLSVSSPPEPPLAPLYQRAADDAFYWSCVCKYELGELDSAIKGLSDYLKRYRRGGQWTYEARGLLAEAYLATGQEKEAIQTIRILESDDPYRDQHAIQLRCWNSASQPSDVVKPPAAVPSQEKPATPEPEKKTQVESDPSSPADAETTNN